MDVSTSCAVALFVRRGVLAGGEAHVDVLVYPNADGGALVYVEPGVEVTEMRAVTSGGWYRSTADLGAMFEGYGAVMSKAEQKTPAVGPSPGAYPSEPAGIWLPVALTAALSFLLVQAVRKRRRDGLV